MDVPGYSFLTWISAYFLSWKQCSAKTRRKRCSGINDNEYGMMRSKWVGSTALVSPACVHVPSKMPLHHGASMMRTEQQTNRAPARPPMLDIARHNKICRYWHNAGPRVPSRARRNHVPKVANLQQHAPPRTFKTGGKPRQRRLTCADIGLRGPVSATNTLDSTTNRA